MRTQAISALRCARHHLRSTGGFMLIEMMVALAIGGILSVVIVTGFAMATDGIVQSKLASDRMAWKQFAADTLRTDFARAGALGLPDGHGGTDPLSLAGDQVVFAGANGRCYRIFFVRATGELRQRVDSDCASHRPVRGPNEAPANGEVHARPGDADYDPVLDGGEGSLLLATGIESNTESRPAPVFRCLDGNGQALRVADLAASDSTEAGYVTRTDAEDLASVVTSLTLSASNPNALATQTFTWPTAIGQ